MRRLFGQTSSGQPSIENLLDTGHPAGCNDEAYRAPRRTALDSLSSLHPEHLLVASCLIESGRLAMPKHALEQTTVEGYDSSLSQVNALLPNHMANGQRDKIVGRVDEAKSELRGEIRHTETRFYIVVVAVCGIALIIGGLWKSSVADKIEATEKRVELKITSEVASQVTPLKTELAVLNTRLSLLLKSPELTRELTSILQRLTTGQADDLKGNLETARELIVEAQNQGVVLDPKIVSDLGLLVLEKYAGVSAFMPAAWETTTTLTEYRTFINAKLNPDLVPPKPRTGDDDIQFIGNYFEGKTIKLDRRVWTNNTFNDCVIIYNGDPVTLANNRFENCKFELPINEKTKAFTQAILASNTPSVSFTSVS